MKYLFLIFILVNHNYVYSQESKNSVDKIEKIERLLELSGSKASFEVAINQVIDMQIEMFDNANSTEFLELFRNDILDDGYDKLLTSLIPIYIETYTDSEIDGIIKFYESDVGKSFVSKSPVLLSKSILIGKEWGISISEEIARRIENSNNELFDLVITDDLSKFKDGEFYYYLPDSSIINIERMGDKNIEVYNGDRINLNIEWITNNKAVLKDIEDEISLIGNSNAVFNIYSYDENSYSYIFKMPDGTFTKGIVYIRK